MISFATFTSKVLAEIQLDYFGYPCFIISIHRSISSSLLSKSNRSIVHCPGSPKTLSSWDDKIREKSDNSCSSFLCTCGCWTHLRGYIDRRMKAWGYMYEIICVILMSKRPKRIKLEYWLWIIKIPFIFLFIFLSVSQARRWKKVRNVVRSRFCRRNNHPKKFSTFVWTRNVLSRSLTLSLTLTYTHILSWVFPLLISNDWTREGPIFLIERKVGKISQTFFACFLRHYLRDLIGIEYESMFFRERSHLLQSTVWQMCMSSSFLWYIFLPQYFECAETPRIRVGPFGPFLPKPWWPLLKTFSLV